MSSFSVRKVLYWAGQALEWTDRRERWVLLGIAVSQVLAVLAEVGGIGLVYAYFSLVLNPEKISNFSFLARLQEATGLATTANGMALMTLVVMIVFIARTALLAWVKWLSLTFRLRLQRRISARLYDYYATSSYLEHQMRKQAVVMNNIWSNSAAAISSCTLGVVEIGGSIALMVGFSVVVAWVEPMVTLLAIFGLTALLGVYWVVIHRKVSAWGKEALELTYRMFGLINEVFTGFKTVKIYKLEREYSANFKDAVMKQTSLVRINAMLQEAPRLGLELLIVVSILAVVGSIFLRGGDAKSAIPPLMLFGMAAVRLIPALSRVINGLQTFKFSIPALEMALADYRKLPPANADQAPGDVRVAAKPVDSLRLDHVFFKYGSSDAYAVRDVTLEIRHGEFIGFVGESGSGKTTTADLLLGLLVPTSGEVLIDAKATRAIDGADSLQFAFVPQAPFILADSFANNITLPSRTAIVDTEKLKYAIRACGLSGVVDRLPAGVNTILGEGEARLSGGEEQRLCLARALYHDEAPVLVLDEPTSALDSITERLIADTLMSLRGKRTIVMVAHRLHTLKYCDRLYFFKQGRVEGSGTFETLLEQNEDFRKMVHELRLPAAQNMEVIPS